jgi:hypothetical protein
MIKTVSFLPLCVWLVNLRGGGERKADSEQFIVRPIENPKKAPARFLPSWPEMLRTGPELFSGFQFDVVYFTQTCLGQALDRFL